MEKCHQHQLARIDRLMKIVEADNPYELVKGLMTIDVMIFACQSMWHLKDWILNDAEFGAKDDTELRTEIYSCHCLLVCSDLANGSKHLSLKRPHVGSTLSEEAGIHIDSSKGICQELYYVVCPDVSDECHGMEVRTLLRRCRNEWEKIISRHHLANVYDLLESQK